MSFISESGARQLSARKNEVSRRTPRCVQRLAGLAATTEHAVSWVLEAGYRHLRRHVGSPFLSVILSPKVHVGSYNDAAAISNIFFIINDLSGGDGGIRIPHFCLGISTFPSVYPRPYPRILRRFGGPVASRGALPLASHAERNCYDGHLMMRTFRSASRVLVCFVIVTPTAHMIPAE